MSTTNYVCGGMYEPERRPDMSDVVPFKTATLLRSPEYPEGVQAITYHDGNQEFVPLPHVSVAEPMPRPSELEPKWKDGSRGSDTPELTFDVALPSDLFYRLISSGELSPDSRQIPSPTPRPKVVMPAMSRPAQAQRNQTQSPQKHPKKERREEPIAQSPQSEPPKTGPSFRENLRDIVFLDILGLPAGDSPLEVYKTGFWEIGQSIKTGVPTVLGAVHNITQGTAESARTMRDRVTPHVRRTAAVATVAAAATVGSVIATGQMADVPEKNFAKPVVMMPVELTSVTVPLQKTEDLNALADSLQIGPEEMAMLAQAAGISPGELTEPAELTLELRTSEVELSSPATADQIAERFGLTQTLIEAANPGSTDEARMSFRIPGRMVFATSVEQPNVSSVAQVVGVDPALAESLNTANDGLIALPVHDEVDASAEKAVAMALLAPNQPEDVPVETVSETIVPPTTAAPATTAPAAEAAQAQPSDPALELSPPPSMPEKNPEQMTDTEYMQWLASEVNPTVADLFALQVDTSRMGAFDSELSGTRIQPTKFVGHWTAGLYENGVDQFVSSIKGRDGDCCNVTYFMDLDGQIYQFADPNIMTSHAKGANSFSQGVEIEARGLRDYGPQQMRNFVLLAYRFMREQNIPIERPNFTGHEEVDVIHAHRGWKSDMPTELVDMLFPKLKALDDLVKAQDAQDQAVVESIVPEVHELSSQERYDALIDMLLAEISSHEGGIDSVNTGDAGDTKVGSERYNQILGGRLLSELTIAEVMELQAQDLLFAVGYMQFIPDTLKGAVQVTGIDTTRKFDLVTQKELAIKYLIFGKRKHLKGYINGENYSLDSATQDLCQEFASMPCPNGEGFYDGDSAGNNAKNGLQRLPHIRGVLIMLRTAQQDRIADMHAAALAESEALKTLPAPTTEPAPLPAPTDTTPPTTEVVPLPAPADTTTTTPASTTSTTLTSTTTTSTPAEQLILRTVLSEPDAQSAEASWLPVETAKQVVTVYLGSEQAAEEWLDAQIFAQDGDGSNTRVFVDPAKLTPQGE